MTEGEWRVPGQQSRLELVHQVDVGMTGTGATHFDHDLSRTGLRLIDLL
jgi:hypothetical protein